MLDFFQRPIQPGQYVACKYVMSSSSALTVGYVIALTPTKVKVSCLVPMALGRPILPSPTSKGSRIEYKDPSECIIIDAEIADFSSKFPELFI